MTPLSQLEHPIVHTGTQETLASRVLYLMHCKAYEQAASMAHNQDVLDWGCNDGYGIDILGPFARSVAGLDVAPAAVHLARSKHPGHTIRLAGSDPDFPPESFDVVTSFQVIEHVEDCDGYLSGVRSVLRPGGRFIATTPNRNIRLDPGMEPWNPFHVREFSAADLHTLLSRWFSHVEVFGLHASPEVEAIERARCKDARQKVRHHNRKRILPPYWKVRTAGIEAIKSMLPNSAVEFLRRELPAAAPAAPAAPITRFSTADFWYSNQAVDQALDLMVVCRKNEGATKATPRTITG